MAGRPHPTIPPRYAPDVKLEFDSIMFVLHTNFNFSGLIVFVIDKIILFKIR